MTLGQAITRLATRFAVDVNSEIDTTDNDAMTNAIIDAANRVARDTYFLWTWKSPLTLSNNVSEYNTLASAISTQPVFHVYHIHINGAWLTYHRPDQFIENFSNYFSAAAHSKPSDYTLFAPSNIKLAVPADTVAAAASDNFIAGFRLHTRYTYASNAATELEGPDEMHDLIVDRAFLDNSVSYVAGDEGFTRRAMIEDKYNRESKKFKSHNLSLYKPIVRSGNNVGSTRRISSLGRGWG